MKKLAAVMALMLTFALSGSALGAKAAGTINVIQDSVPQFTEVDVESSATVPYYVLVRLGGNAMSNSSQLSAGTHLQEDISVFNGPATYTFQVAQRVGGKWKILAEDTVIITE